MNIKTIPLSVLDMIAENNRSHLKIGLMQGSPIKIKQSNKDALLRIKEQNGMQSVDKVIELLIATVAMFQYSNTDIDNDELMSKPKIGRFSHLERKVIINGRVFDSISSASKFYKCDRQTIKNRILNTSNIGLRNWNYEDEDIELKYDIRRVN